MKNYDWTKEKVEPAVKKNQCYSDVLRELGVPVRGRNSDTLKRKIKEYNLDMSHFTFTSKNKGESQKTPVEQYLVKGSKIKTYNLKQKLLSSGLKENKCEICGCTTWLDKPIICQLHHIDGDESNNELSNLQMLCPNCHSQTDNYCGQANKKEKKKYYCSQCGRQIKTNAKLCPVCSAKNRKRQDWDSEIENIKKYILEGKNNTKIGEIYNVSEATIRKYRKKFNI